MIRCCGYVALLAPVLAPVAAHAGDATRVVSLDGDGWLIAHDGGNVGREERWWEAPRAEAVPTRVPWIAQDAFPGRHGVFWYWRELGPVSNPNRGGRTFIWFWQVDYAAEVWLNDARVGEHEDGETAFEVDVTDAIRTDGGNLLVVRVLNPTHEPIDGIVLDETPHRNKAIPYSPGSDYDHGGIVDSVELLLRPVAWVAGLYARPDPQTGRVDVSVTLGASDASPREGRVILTVAPAADGVTIDQADVPVSLAATTTTVEGSLTVPQPRMWELSAPFLYRVTARLELPAGGVGDDLSTRCGFRSLRFQNGAFRLNGRRLYLRSSHTGNCCPGGLHLPHDPDILRRDLLNVKVMGFNAIRFIAGVAGREQLDLCDEIGLMVYEEPYAAWCLADSPKMAERYDRSTLGMVLRDRNHPSVVIWGLLNETPDGAVFRHAAGMLPRLRELDATRMVMLNSGRWDAGNVALTGLQLWRTATGPDPNVTHNPTFGPLSGLGIRWAPGDVALHPGPNGEYSVLRFTAPAEGDYSVRTVFHSIAQAATTDVHILAEGRSVFSGLVNVGGSGPSAEWEGSVRLSPGGTLDFVVGWGNGTHGGDTTALSALIRAPGGEWDPAAGFSLGDNPSGPFGYGSLPSADRPDVSRFTSYTVAETIGEASGVTGSLSNPGSSVWENVLSDQHNYPRVPHSAETIRMLRELSGGALPVFLSEYGIGSAVHLPRVVRQYDQHGLGHTEDASLYRDQLARFMADWERWRIGEAFASPDDYFDRTLAKMAGQRLLGLNAIRANPSIVGYSLTGTVDQGWTGEGLTTTFRDLKPGTVDALFDGFAPLRLCVFAEPNVLYRGAALHLEVVLANEDALPAGEYRVRCLVIGPSGGPAFDREVPVTISQGAPFAVPVLGERVTIDGAPGTWRVFADFVEGASAAGGRATFAVYAPADLPRIEGDVEMIGDDPDLARWLEARGARARQFSGAGGDGRIILVAGGAGSTDPRATGDQLAERVRGGAVAVVLAPEGLGLLPAEIRGKLVEIPSWLYLVDCWAKAHPVFDGLPTGLLDDTYRDLIPDAYLTSDEAPDEALAGGIKASQGYASGLLVEVRRYGKGAFLLSTLRFRPHLGANPVADRIAVNMLRYASGL